MDALQQTFTVFMFKRRLYHCEELHRSETDRLYQGRDLRNDQGAYDRAAVGAVRLDALRLGSGEPERAPKPVAGVRRRYLATDCRNSATV